MKGTLVDCYRNLHKQCWSVRDAKTRKVIAHVDTISLTDAVFRVGQAGRERVLREKRKNVHAYVRGMVSEPFEGEEFQPVSYNPYTAGTFVMAPFGTPVYAAEKVTLLPNGRLVAQSPSTQKVV